MNELYKFGISQEEKIKPILEEAFCCKFNKTPGRYHSFDFISEDKKVYIEIKSRHCLERSYSTTKIGYNKISKAQDLHKKGISVFFVFNFIDKICVYETGLINQKWVQINPTYKSVDYNIPLTELEEIYTH